MRGFAQTGTLVIEQLLQSESDPSIIAIEVRGTFETDDVLNVYANDQFIKSKVISSSEDGSDVAVTIRNISVDVLRTGANELTVSIERSGVDLQTSSTFRVVIQNIPDRPDIAVTEGEGGYTVTVTGSFDENDVITVFLNGEPVTTVPATPDLVAAGEVSVTVESSALADGDNAFEASIQRGDFDSGLSDRKIVAVATVVEESVVRRLPVCVRYVDQGEIRQSPGSRWDEFGSAVSMRGDTIAIGDATGEVAMYARDGVGEEQAWSRAATFSGGHYTRAREEKKAVMLDGEGTLLVGTATAGYQGERSGVVETFTAADGLWSEAGVLAPDNLAAHEMFGSALAVGDSILAVTAASEDEGGKLYVYDRGPDGTSWIHPSVIASTGLTDAIRFGEGIAVNGGTVAVGAPGDRTAFVYTRSGNLWRETRIPSPGSERTDEFGSAVLFVEDLLVVGAPGNRTRGSDIGTVYFYERGESGAWHLGQKLSAPVGARNFGSVLAHYGGALAVGAPRTVRENSKTGGVFIFTNDGDAWVLQDTVIPADLKGGDRFGTSIALFGEDLLVGAPGDDFDRKTNTGSTYLFSATESTCSTAVISDTAPEPGASLEEVVADLKERRDRLEDLNVSVQSLIESLWENISATREEITRREDKIVVFDWDGVSGEAQRRAAAVRGVIAPGIPPEVTVEQHDARSASIPDEDEVRGRVQVVSETLQDVGIVVPVAQADLAVGDDHEDVYRLQAFLNQNGYQVAPIGPGSPGNETSVFNEATERALKRFQVLSGIPQTGVLDKQTRDVILTYVGSF